MEFWQTLLTILMCIVLFPAALGVIGFAIYFLVAVFKDLVAKLRKKDENDIDA